VASVGNPITGPRNTIQDSLEFSDSLSSIRARHQLRIGGEFRRSWINAEQGIASNGFFVFAPFPFSNSIANLLTGSAVVFLQAGGQLQRNLSSNDFSGYIQDEWQLTHLVTLNFGLRYQVNTPFVEANNRLAGFRPGQQSVVHPEAPMGLVYPGDPGVPAGLVDTYTRGVAPRAGISWDPTGRGTMSVRASYGLFFEPITWGQGGILQAAVSAPPYLQTRQVSGLFSALFGLPGPSFSNPFPGVSNPFPPGNFPHGITGLTLDRHLSPPYVQNWNMSVQRELGHDYLVEVRYVGTKGTRLPRFVEGNPPIYDPSQPSIDRRRLYANCQGSDGPCDFNSIGLITGNANSIYHAMQLTVSHRFARGFFLSSSYTWAKSLDDVSSLNETGSAPNGISGESDLAQNPFNLRAERGSSIFDTRHRWVMSSMWETPFFKSKSQGFQRLLAHWQINGILNVSSSTPFTVYDSVDYSQSGSAPEIQGYAANRPNLVSNPNKGPRTVQEWFDISAFQRLDPQTSGGMYGNAGRNIVNGPGFTGLDASLLRNFQIRESLSLQFRAEWFNVLNHPNFYIPQNDIASPNFGRILQAAPPRLLQFGMKVLF
jgi:hypothetical protein